MSKQNESAFNEIKAFLLSTKALLESVKVDIKQIREDSSSANAQILELYSIMNNVGVKLDLLEQNKFNASIIAEKQPTKKRQTKSKIDTPTSEIFDPTDANYEIDDDISELKEITPNIEIKSSEFNLDTEIKEEVPSKVIKKTGKVAKKKEHIEEPDESIKQSQEDHTGKQSESKESVSKKTKSKKETGEDNIKKKREPNRMEFFYKMYDKDNKYFSDYITEENERQIEDANKELWLKLPHNEMLQCKRIEMYNFMSKNHSNMLIEMKNKYNFENKQN
jgi:hypothetical protein